MITEAMATIPTIANSGLAPGIAAWTTSSASSSEFRPLGPNHLMLVKAKMSWEVWTGVGNMMVALFAISMKNTPR